MVLMFVMVSVSFGENFSNYSIPKNLHVYNSSGDAYVDVKFNGSYKRAWLKVSHPKYNAIFALLLAAQLNDETVQIRSLSTNSQGQPVIDGVYLRN